MLDITVKRDVASSYGILPYTIDNTLDDASASVSSRPFIPLCSNTMSSWRSTPSSNTDPKRSPASMSNHRAGSRLPISTLVKSVVEGRAARDQPPGPVPLGYDLVQSRPGCRDRRCGKRHPAGLKRSWRAALTPDEFPGQRPGIRSIAEEHTYPYRRIALRHLPDPRILYESVIHPITIISTLPSAGLGALLLLVAVHADLSVIAIVGLILLIGIVKKNGIMLVDFAQQSNTAKA